MLDWIRTQWGNCLTNPSTPGSTGKVLVADSHCAQQTDSVKSFLAKTKRAFVNIGGAGVNLVSASSYCQQTIQNIRASGARETHRRKSRYGGENNNISKTDSYDSMVWGGTES